MLQVSKNSIISLINKILLALLFIFVFYSCKHEKQTNQNTLFYCSAEHSNGEFLLGENNTKQKFKGVELLDSTEKHSGKYSVRLDSVSQFAFTTEIKLKSQVSYELTFWKYGESKVAAVVQSKIDKYYISSTNIYKTEKSGWEKVRLLFDVPLDLKDKGLKIYVWNVGKNEVYVDDFKLKKYEIEQSKNVDTLSWIYLDDAEFKKLYNLRAEALKKGVLVTEDDSWVKGMIIWGDESYKVKLRLKGDWTDHLNGKKWSFRIKIKNAKAFKRMKIYSVQNPKTRHFIDQWFLYTLFRDEGLLAPRYGFIFGQLNDDFLGIYAYEEHFEKQLLESALRREGPILKYSEDAFWDLILAHEKYKKWYTYPAYEASKIEPFGTSKTMKSDVLRNEFLIAQNLMYQHKYGISKASDLFDVQKIAKYYALTNVMQGWHGIRWQNQRYYYNPITSNLEIIAYDNYVAEGIFKLFDRAILGDFDNTRIPEKTEEIVNYHLFQDSSFVNYYIFYLKKYSQKSFWDSVFVKKDSMINFYQNMLYNEFGEEALFDKNMYYIEVEKISKDLPKYIKELRKGLYNDLKLPFREKTFYKDSAVTEFIKDYVNVYKESEDEKTAILKIENYFLSDIQIVGIGGKNFEENIKPVTLNKYQSKNNSTEIEVNKKAQYIVVSNGKDKIKIDIMPWPAPKAWSPRQELEQQNKFPNESYYKVVDKKVIFSGKQTIYKIVLIPRGYQVIIKPGTVIDLVNGGGILSYSSVFVQGTKQSPVNIKSSTDSSLGFTVLQAPKVEMKYAIFDGLNAFSYKGWQQTGAVTLYETDVKITNCQFINNLCEDDLNVVRSHFEVTNSVFANTFSDAFDSDFSNGLVDNCTFDKLGNDAIDFSTSRIEIKNCKITKATDKGVSGGEGSHLKVVNCIIDGANIGIASKDLSVVEADNCVIKNTTYALSAFQKKPEYGAAKLIINKLKAENNVQTSLIEKKSLLILDGLNIEGKFKNVAKKFY